MLVLVATTEGQGEVDGDYCWALDGELVLTGALLECVDPDRCGCGRGFPGLGSARATTTAMVVDRPGIDPAQLRVLVHAGLHRQGWLAGLGPSDAAVLIEDEARRIGRLSTSFRVGAVLSRRGDRVWSRPVAA